MKAWALSNGQIVYSTILNYGEYHMLNKQIEHHAKKIVSSIAPVQYVDQEGDFNILFADGTVQKAVYLQEFYSLNEWVKENYTNNTGFSLRFFPDEIWIVNKNNKMVAVIDLSLFLQDQVILLTKIIKAYNLED
jgi:hypothetical protein